jgi:excisionase family DNA binding protein
MQSEIGVEQPLRRRAWTVAEVAEQLGRHKASVYRLIYTGHLRPLPGTGDRLISEHELDRYLRSVQDKSANSQKKHRVKAIQPA